MQRYSGPELGELLDRVVSELGPSAEISEVNKIRSGGVAGFFCREEYEIVVDPRSTVSEEKVAAGVGSDVAAGAVSAPQQGATIAAPKASQGATSPTPAPDPDPEPVAEPIMAKAESPHRVGDGASEVFGGPRPRTLDGSDERFLALLERRLEETSETEASLTGRTIRRPTKRPSAKLPVQTPSSTEDQMPAVAVSPSRSLSIEVADPEPEAGFWSRTRKAGQELAALLPDQTSFLAVLGPLSLTTPVVRRIRAETELSAADVVVLTDRAEIISEPQWRLVRSGHQLLEVAAERAGQPTMFVIDVPVELPQWVAPLQQRLRLVGVEVFRYAVPGTPSAAQLQRYRLGSDVPYILELVSRVEPEHLVQLIDQQHPVGSVGGATLTAELLVAMREQVGVGW